MKLMTVALFGFLSFSAFGKTLESFNCRTNLLKIVLEEGEKERATIFFAGLQKSYDIVENRYIAHEVRSFMQKENFTKIILNNPDNTFFNKEQYIIELNGNLFSAKDTVTMVGTMTKLVVPYGIFASPVQSYPTPVSCLAKLQAK